jgi:hypothetical protein
MNSERPEDASYAIPGADRYDRADGRLLRWLGSGSRPSRVSDPPLFFDLLEEVGDPDLPWAAGFERSFYA